MAVAILLGTLWMGATATPAGALTLDEALSQALEHSRTLNAAEREAEAARLEASGVSLSRLPSVTFGLEAVRSDHPVQVFSGLLSQQQFAQENFGSVDFSTGAFDLSPLNQPDPHTNVRASVMVRQTLWSGGFVTGRLNATRAGADAMTAMSERTREQVALQTETIFRHAILAGESLAVIRDMLTVAEGHADRVRRMQEEGLALESDRMALAAFVEEVRARLAAATADSVEARSLLGLVTGAGEPVTEPLVDPKRQDGPSAPSLSDALGTAESRADVEAAQAAHRASRAGKRMALAQLFPAFEVGAVAEHNSETFFGDGGNQWTVMLGARLQLDPGVASRVRAAAARERAAAENAALAGEGARHETRTAWARLDAARGRQEALDRASVAAREAFRLTERRHEEGLATALELTESQTTMTRTLLEAAAARHDAAIAEAAYRFASGTLLSQEDR